MERIIIIIHLLLLIWVSENPCLGNVITTPLRRKKRPPSRLNIGDLQALELFTANGAHKENRGIIIEEIRNREGIEYYGELELGSELQSLTFVLDTGSPWLWVPVSECQFCHTTQLFNSEESTTFRLQPGEQHLQYGKGQVWGQEAFDTITIGGVQIENQQFLAVTKDQNLEAMRSAGIMGINLDSMKSGGIIYNLKEQGHIGKGMIGMHLSNLGSEGSELYIGGYDTSLVEGKNIHWAQVTDQKHWIIELNSVFMQDRPLLNSPTSVLIDSGTSYLLIPQSDFRQIEALLKENFSCGYINLYFYCQCSSKSYSQFPDINLEMGGHKFSLLPKDYIKFMEHNNYGNYYAVFKIIISSQIKFWILGDNFMNNYYTIFDFEEQRLGFVGLNRSIVRSNLGTDWWNITWICLAILLMYAIFKVAKWYMKHSNSEFYVSQHNIAYVPINNL